LVNFAVIAVVSAVTVNVHVFADPAQPPLQLSSRASFAGIAVKVTLVPAGKFAEHVGGQSIPAGPVTLPGPCLFTVTVKFEGGCGGGVVTLAQATFE
jgi:hypothetical protein